jgi:hypothetical protein
MPPPSLSFIPEANKAVWKPHATLFELDYSPCHWRESFFCSVDNGVVWYPHTALFWVHLLVSMTGAAWILHATPNFLLFQTGGAWIPHAAFPFLSSSNRGSMNDWGGSVKLTCCPLFLVLYLPIIGSI